MSAIKQTKDKLGNAIMEQFDNPKVLGQSLIEKEKSAMIEMINDNKVAYGYPDSVKADEIVDYLETSIKSKIDADSWVDIVDKYTLYDTSDEAEIEKLINNENDIQDIIFMNLDEGCDAQIMIPEYEDFARDLPEPENFQEEIENYLRTCSPNEIKEAVELYSDEADIKSAVKKAGEQEGIPADKLDEITKYELKDIKCNISIDLIASRYRSDAIREGSKSFIENNLLKALVEDNLITYDVEILENPEDF